MNNDRRSKWFTFTNILVKYYWSILVAVAMEFKEYFLLYNPIRLHQSPMY